MSTTQEAPPDDPAEAEEYDFTPKLSPRWALNIEQVVAVAIFGALFVLLNFIPIRGTDIWNHVIYGQQILQDQAIPTADPWMPLATGMEVIDTAWLSQVIFGAVDKYFGPEAISHLFAIVNLLAYLVFARLFFLQTRRVWLSLFCTALLIFVGWSRFATVRPENFAVLCLALVFLLAVRLQRRNYEADEALARGESLAPRSFDFFTWLGIGVLFALWANLHGSYAIGIAVLGCYLLGRMIEVAWRTRDFGAILADAATRRWVVIVELAFAATLLNPYGLDLWIHTVKFSANPNLATILEWQPLVVFGVGGRPFAISIVLLLFIWRQSQRPIRPAEVLLLALFGFAALTGIRMLGWYAPVFVVVVAPHIADIARRLLPTSWTEERIIPEPPEPADGEEPEYIMPEGRSFRFTLVGMLLIWIAFALAPISQMLFNKSRPPESLYSKDTPLKLTAFLNSAYEDESLPGGLVFQPQWWGDWIVRAGPKGFQPFATSNIHLIPPQVWSDYLRINELQGGWERTLDRYDIDTMIVDREGQEPMYRALSRNTDWELRYEDDQAGVFARKSALPATSPTPAGDANPAEPNLDDNRKEEETT